MRADNANPYVGLRPYKFDESILFFGRNEQTLELLQHLRQHHFVAVVGSSGCGKSSLLRAGLIPALKAGYLVGDSDHWFVAIMKPGQNPLYNLAEAILQQVDPTINATDISSLAQKISEEGTGAITDILTPLAKQKNVNFFLLVDQFEELFRFAMGQKNIARKDEAIDFVNIVLDLSQQKDLPFYVVLTMRSDFIGDCDQFYGLPEAMNKSQYLVPRLNRIQLKTVIEGPARLYGGKLDPSLTSRLLNESGKIRDELPLLQHALMRIWDNEMNVDKNGELDLQDYENIGGIEKALSNHADEALKGLIDEDLGITKKMFQALTAIDENGRKIRRPVLLSQLKELTGATEKKLLEIIDLFIKDRRSFLVVNKAGNTVDKIIDISHESLIRQWNTCSQWVDEEGISASNYLRLAEAAKLYKQKEKDFLSGSELQLALAWYNKSKPVADWGNRYKVGFEETIEYLMNSEKEAIAIQKQEDERRRQEEERQQNEKVGKQKQRRLTIGLVVLLIFVIGAIAATLMIVHQNKLISEQKAETENALKKTDSLLEKERGLNAELSSSIQKAKTADSVKKILEADLTQTGKEKLKAIQRTLLVAGSHSNGGIIVSLDDSKQHGLVVAESDQNDGSKTNWNDAKRICDALLLDDFNDWRLPTRNELKQIYSIKNNVGGLNTRGLYWSSDVAGSFAYLINFSNGSTSYNYNKSNDFYVRAVREF
ncbi:MAG: DUF1566 domain-containing protein [Ginsengibacter sp.]